MHEIRQLLDGFERFRVRTYEEADRSLGQDLCGTRFRPRTAVISCSDCPVDPAVLFGSRPGELYNVRNVASLVPPYELEGSFHGVSASMELAVCSLEVGHVVVLGHSECFAISLLLRGLPEPRDGLGFLGNWLRVVADVRHRVTSGALAGKSREVQARAAEHNAVLVSMVNLLSFPWVQERVERRALFLHGWYFDLRHGELQRLDPSSGRFDAVTESMHEAE